MRNKKLRYYLRGLGIGILVTAFILGITDDGEVSITDAQIRERAYELGMVDGDLRVLSELRNNEEASGQETLSNTDFDLDEEEQETTTVPETISEQTMNAEDMEETVEETKDTTELITSNEEASVREEIVYFEIAYGENSHNVSVVLAELGLVADAEAFDNYLVYNGYSKFIRTGNYAIVLGTSEEEIAKLITGIP